MALISSHAWRPAASAGLAAMALAAGAQPAFAQFAATPTVNSGSITDGATGGAISSRTDLFIVDTSAVVTWTTDSTSTGGPFLPQGASATFWDGGVNRDFSVLNRIVSTSPAEFIGRVQSLVGSQPGGTVWFSSPSGIIVNANASFDVGNLLLTTADFPTGFAFPASGGTFAINAGGGTARVANDGIIRSQGYTALVAPRITQSGRIQAGGAVALVAAQQVTLRLPSATNLFDIEITTGAAANPQDTRLITHTGDTVSTSAAGGTGPRGMTIAAASQNAGVVTDILLGGTVQVNDAAITGKGIVLSAGAGITGGAVTANVGGPVDVLIGSAPADSLGVYAHRSDADFDIHASGTIRDTAAGSETTASRLIADGRLALTAGGDIDLSGQYSGGAIVAQAADLTVNAGGQLNASGTAGVGISTPTGLTAISGTVLAPAIDIRSADLAIGTGGALGGPATTLITLRPENAQVTIGGTATSGTGYQIDTAELGQMRAATLAVTDPAAGATGDYDITVGTTTIDGDRLNAVRVTTPGSILVNGRLLMTNANTRTLELGAGRRLDVVTPSGGIDLRAGNGLAGSLILRGDNILVANDQLRTLSRANPLFDNRRDLLEAVPAAPVPEGYVSAGAVRFEVGSTLHVQNTGTEDAFGGISAGSFTIDIASAEAEIFLSGRQVNGNAIIDDDSLRDEIIYPRAEGANGAVNGCLLNAGSCFIDFPPPPPLTTFDELTGTSEEGNIVRSPDGVAVELIDTKALEAGSLLVIEEPVTGTGNTESWRSLEECQEEDRSKCP